MSLKTDSIHSRHTKSNNTSIMRIHNLLMKKGETQETLRALIGRMIFLSSNIAKKAHLLDRESIQKIRKVWEVLEEIDMQINKQ